MTLQVAAPGAGSTSNDALASGCSASVNQVQGLNAEATKRSLANALRLERLAGRTELTIDAVKAVLSKVQRLQAVVDEVYVGLMTWKAPSPSAAAKLAEDLEDAEATSAPALLVPSAIQQSVHTFLLGIASECTDY
jgi:hypothetical protein